MNTDCKTLLTIWQLIDRFDLRVAKLEEFRLALKLPKVLTTFATAQPNRKA
jgi:hypothetical protein